MLTYEQKYENMKKRVIKLIGEEKFNKIKEKIFYSFETNCFYLCKSGEEHQYQFYDSERDYLTTGFEGIFSAY